MSVEELMFMVSQIERGCPRNIDCGMLRAIGKTNCIRQLIQRNNQRNNIVLVHTRHALDQYRDIAEVFVVNPYIPLQVAQSELSRTLNPSNLYHIYADEVRNAEQIVEHFNPARVVFVVGFFSVSYDYRRRQLERTSNERQRLTRYEQLTFDGLRRAERNEEAQRRQQISLEEIRRAERLMSIPSQKPNFFETSWVQDPAPPLVETEKVNVKMRFIV
jgi:hypothetical protein